MKEPRSITVVLSASGSWGLAHVGVIEVLQKEGLSIERIVGVSSGSFFGGLIASGNSATHLIALMKKAGWGSVKSWRNLAFSLKGLFRPHALMKFLKEHLKKKNIEDFPIKFAAVAGEVTEGFAVVFDSGDAFDAIRSSISVPGLVSPVERDDHIYVDGAYISPLPVGTARSYNPEILVAIDIRIYSSVFSDRIKKTSRNAASIFHRALALLFWQLSEREIQDADLVIQPVIRSSTSYLDFVYDETIVEAGREAGRKALPELKKLVGIS